jgi:hypothetical protein
MDVQSTRTFLGLAANILTPACATFVMGVPCPLGRSHIARLWRDYVAKTLAVGPAYVIFNFFRGLTRVYEARREIDRRRV